MARQLMLAIAESAESLEQQLKTSRAASQKERLHGYKVVLVLHIPLTDERKEFPPDHNVEVYAIGADHLKAQKESGYFPKPKISIVTLNMD